MQSEQLSIFENELCGEVFEISNANIRYLNSKVRYCELLVMVPKSVKSIEEVKPSIEHDEQYELFELYTEGIWLFEHARQKSYKWEQAEIECKIARDKNVAVRVRVYLKEKQFLIPIQVIHYL